MLAVGDLVVPSIYWDEQLKIDRDRFLLPPAQCVEIIADCKSLHAKQFLNLIFIQQKN